MRGVCWGHAVSDDLIHWEDLPFAFAADETDLSCFSGQTWVEENRVIAIYHGKGAGNCIAESSDPLLLNWRKNPKNPVIPDVASDEEGYPYRIFDPCIWRRRRLLFAFRNVSRVSKRKASNLQPSFSFQGSDTLGVASSLSRRRFFLYYGR